MNKTKDETEITKQKLLYSALSVFSRLGYDKTSLEDIAKEAGFTRGAIYHNFGGKVQIFKALIDEFGVSASSIVKDVYCKDISPCDNIRLFIEKSLVYLEDNEDYRKTQMLIRFSNLHLYEELHDICIGISNDVDVFLSYLSDLLQAAIEQGEIAENTNIKAVAVSILGLVNGTSALWLINQTGFSIKEYAGNISECFVAGIKNRLK